MIRKSFKAHLAAGPVPDAVLLAFTTNQYIVKKILCDFPSFLFMKIALISLIAFASRDFNWDMDKVLEQNL